jgi:lipopolysaccharide transport system ATP-binding protein
MAIKADKLSKVYPVFEKPIDRLKQFFWRNRRTYYKAFTALEDVSFELEQGDILGIVGRNGSGKSTLLQLICNTLTSTAGELTVNGRIAALLELGAGFNPEFSGRENIFLNASILGLSEEEITARYEAIVEFSGIRDFIDQPVKTYSSGMYVRLAFSVAVSVDPDILIIDEALSVGDGAFARKSFERIMGLKRAGKTILFCSHSMYQVEALCNKALWLDQGQVKMLSSPAEVVVAYNNFLESFSQNETETLAMDNYERILNSQTTRFTKIQVKVNGQPESLVVTSSSSMLSIKLKFVSDTAFASPSVGVSIYSMDGKVIASSSTHNDGFNIPRDGDGKGQVEVLFPALPLLKGRYYIDVFLACENALHLYEHAMHITEFEVVQQGLEQGVVALAHEWK